jgi:hypothetical protein
MNPNIGFGQGQLYDKVEGNAKAAILKGGKEALQAGQDVADIELNFAAKEKAAKEKALLAADAKKKEATEKIKGLLPEDLWWKHGAEMQGQYDKLLDMHADLQSAGVGDPFAGTDPASRAFQKEYAKGMQMVANSNQLKDQYTKDRNEINQNPSKYTDDSKLAVFDYYDKNTLSDITSKSLLPSNLRPVQPLHDKTKYYQTVVDARGKDTEPTDAELFDFAKTALTDQGQVGYLPAMQETYDRLPAEKKEQLAKSAEDNKIAFFDKEGKDISPLVIMAKEELKPYFSTEPIDIDALIEKGMPAGDVLASASSYTNQTGVTTSKSSNVTSLNEDKLDAAATTRLTPKVLSQLIEERRKFTVTKKDGTTETVEVSNDETAKEYIKQAMRTRFETKKETASGTARDLSAGLDKETGISKEILDKDADFYYQSLFDVVTPEKTAIAKQFGFDLNKPEDAVKFQSSLYQQAAQAAIGMPVPGGSEGSIVTNAKVVWKNREGQQVAVLNDDFKIDDFWNGSGKDIIKYKNLVPELVLETGQKINETETGDTDAGGKKTTSKKTIEKGKEIKIALDKRDPDANGSQATNLNSIYRYKVKRTGTTYGYNRKGELGGIGSDIHTRYQVETGENIPMNSPSTTQTTLLPKKKTSNIETTPKKFTY